MGSRARNSSGRKAASRHARKGKCNPTRRKPVPQLTPDFDAILGRLSDSMSIIATAANALTHAQEGTGTVAPADVGEVITTLEHGVRALRSAYNDMDVAIRELRA
jgi:hypothetical protein